MIEFAITKNLVNALLDYLATKPYKEVAMLIGELTRLKPIIPPENKEG